MTQILAALVLLVLVGSFATAASAQTVTAGSFRIFQASPDTTSVDIVVNGKKTVSGLKYQNVSDYMNLPSGSYDIKVYVTGSVGAVTPVVDLPKYNINDGSVSTLVIAGLSKNNSLTALQLSDNNWVADPTKAKVRFVHGTPDMAAVDITVSGLGEVFKNVSFKSTSSYMEVAPGAATLSAKLTTTHKEVLTKNLNFEVGKVYTVYATGLANEQTVGVVVSVDNTVPAAMPSTGLGGAAASNQPAFAWVWLAVLAGVGIVGGGAFFWTKKQG